MIDHFGRKIDYLRISITDRCNLRCRYCMPKGIVQMPMHDILTYEEILMIVKVARNCGITKIKVTGGEPLVRKGCAKLIQEIKQIDGIKQVTLTTNGILLQEEIGQLKQAGLDAVNISLDTLNRKKFLEITGFDAFSKVMQGIESALQYHIPTKINTVLQKGMNDTDWEDIMRLAKDNCLDVRFIEMMPIGQGKQFDVIYNDDLLKQIEEKYPGVKKDETIHGNGPATYIHLDGFKGSVGFISAMHGKFCNTCNRLRLTSTGLLKPCLCYDMSTDLKQIVRSHHPNTLEELEQAFLQTVKEKPQAHCFEKLNEITEQKRMSDIGG